MKHFVFCLFSSLALVIYAQETPLALAPVAAERIAAPAAGKTLPAEASQREISDILDAFQMPEVALVDLQVSFFAQSLRLTGWLESGRPGDTLWLQRREPTGAWTNLSLIGSSETGLQQFEWTEPSGAAQVYFYRLKLQNGDEAFCPEVITAILPQGGYALYKYPYPALFGARVGFSLRQAAKVQVALLNAGGQAIELLYNRVAQPGEQEVEIVLTGRSDLVRRVRISVGSHSREYALP